jgi:hypothetical protein
VILVEATNDAMVIAFTKEQVRVVPQFLREHGVTFTHVVPFRWNVQILTGEVQKASSEPLACEYCVMARGKQQDFDRLRAEWDEKISQRDTS